MLYVKGISCLLKEELSDIKPIGIIDCHMIPISIATYNVKLLILHIDFLLEIPTGFTDIIQHIPTTMPILILTDDTLAASKLFPVTDERVCCIDVTDTEKKISTMVSKMLYTTN